MKNVKSKLKFVLFPALVLLLAMMVVPVSAADVPTLPHSFSGTVTIDGANAPVPTVISARFNDVEYGTVTTTVVGVYSNLWVTGLTDGDIIQFFVGGADTTQTIAFEAGATTENFNLTVGVALTYDLTVASGDNGSVTEPGEGVFTRDAGAVVDLLAVPGTGYQFLSWTGEVTAVADEYAADTTITMTGNYSITANFALIDVTYSLTVASGDNGSVTTPGEGTFPGYDAGAVVPLLAVPLDGYELVSWTGDVTTVADVNAASTTITMTGNYSITANFALIAVTYTLTVASSAGGSVTEPGEGVFTRDTGTVVDLLAVPLDGYEFVIWTGEVTTVANVNAADTTITMTGDYSITANFALIGVTYSLTVASSAGGSVTEPGEGVFTRDAGAVVPLLAVPDTDYAFVNWTGAVTTVADEYAADTTITMTGNYSITANFMLSLGDLIDDTPIDGTLTLGAGTYSGGTIDKPMTLTGTEGTVIHGGITIGELTGSNVTIENLTITDYTAYGIRIVKVRAVDTFIIRNNTILGVEGSVVGIEVVEVEASGSLNIMNNAISGNEVGIKLLAAVADATIHFNDITDNTVFGLEQLAVVSDASTWCNWWGDISGPEYEAASFEDWPNNPGGSGNAVSDNVGFTPWLTRDFQTVLDDNIAYFGYPMIWLYTGWNIISTPIALDPGCDTWGEYVDLGDGLATDTLATTYYFDGEIQDYVQVLGTYRLKPCDAIYVKMAEDDIAAILLSPSVSVPSKELYAGWNLVSLAWLHRVEYAKPANEALVTVEEVAGGLTGYKLVVSPGVNAYEPAWIYIAGDSIDPWTDPEALLPPDGWMWMTSGYWVFMLNDGTLAGFTFTPMSLGM